MGRLAHAVLASQHVLVGAVRPAEQPAPPPALRPTFFKKHTSSTRDSASGWVFGASVAESHVLSFSPSCAGGTAQLGSAALKLSLVPFSGGPDFPRAERPGCSHEFSTRA